MSGISIETHRSSDIRGRELDGIYHLFDKSYHNADQQYLSHSITLFEYVSLAMCDDRTVGFALGSNRSITLPRFSEVQTVIFAGITCVDEDFRGRGLSFELQKKSCLNSLPPGTVRILKTGRMAHPVSYRVIAQDENCIPTVGKAIHQWHKEVGSVVAKFYGSEFDPNTFVCKGKGKPIGEPRITIPTDDPSWALFKQVNRNNGDTLLALSWMYSSPENW